MRTSFWCNQDRRDFDGEAEEYTARDGAKYLRGYCPKGHRVVRYVTNRKQDPYYHESTKVREEALKYWKDTLQPGDTGFDTYYPNALKNYRDGLMKKEEDEWKEEVAKKGRKVFG